MDPFATLGLPRRYEIDAQELEARYRELQKALHPDRHAGAGASARRLSLAKAVEVNEAYRTLKDELRRAEALLALHGERPGAKAEDPEFLMEMLELREALDDAKASHDLGRVEALATTVVRSQAEVRAQLVAVLDRAPEAAALSVTERARASALVGRLKYFARFVDEVSAIRDEALS